jgi:hypothetical protein
MGWIRSVGRVSLFAQLILLAALVPDSPLRHLDEPPYIAAIASAATTIAILIFDLLNDQKTVRRLLALFLAGMPMVYIAAWLTRPSGQSDLWIEIAGLVLFGTLAALGLVRSIWFLAAGILAHGLAWDLFHLGSTFIPTWYAVGCAVVDVGFAAYAASRALSRS